MYMLGQHQVDPGWNVATQGSEEPELLAAYEDIDSKARGRTKAW